MSRLSDLRLSTVKHGVAWIICLAMLSPILVTAEDQSEQKHKKNNETSKKDNDENRSNSKNNENKSSENRGKQDNDNQSRDSVRSDNSAARDERRPAAASSERERGASRFMGDIISDSNPAKSPPQRPAAPASEHERDASRSPRETNTNNTGENDRRGNRRDFTSQRPTAMTPDDVRPNESHSSWNAARDNTIIPNHSGSPSTWNRNQPSDDAGPQWTGNTIRNVRDAIPSSPSFTSGPIDPKPRKNPHTDDDDDNDYCYNCSGYPYGPGYYYGSSYGGYEPVEVYLPSINIIKTHVEEIVTPAPAVSGVAKRTALSSNPRAYSFNLQVFLERQVQRVRELLIGRWPGAKQLSQVTIETMEYCDNRSGIVTLTYYDEDNSGRLSIGDRFTFRFENCQDSKVGVTAAGRMELRVTELAGDVVNEIAPYAFGGRFNFDGLNVVNNRTAARSLVQGNTDFSLNARQKLSRQNSTLNR